MTKSKVPIERNSFTITEIAERNGVSRPTVYAAIKSGRLKATRIGTNNTGAIRVTREQEAAWLNPHA